MAEKDERLIKQDPDADTQGEELGTPFYKSATFILVLKISLALGTISSLITGLIITNHRLSDVEAQLGNNLSYLDLLASQQETLINNVKVLTKEQQHLTQKVSKFDLKSAQGNLIKTLSILDEQSQALDKQLAVTRNGMMSLSRMIKGSRVWQEDYKSQYQTLFDENKRLKERINSLRGIEKTERQAPKYLEMDF